MYEKNDTNTNETNTNISETNTNAANTNDAGFYHANNQTGYNNGNDTNRNDANRNQNSGQVNSGNVLGSSQYRDSQYKDSQYRNSQYSGSQYNYNPYGNSYNKDSYNSNSYNRDSYNRDSYNSSQTQPNTNRTSYQGNAYHTGQQYQYGNTYTSAQDTQNAQNKKPEKKKAKKEGNNNSFLKKALVCISLGLLFGICTGLGFAAVNMTAGTFAKEDTAIVTEQENENLLEDKESAVTQDAEEVVSDSVDVAEAIRKTQESAGTITDVSDVASAVMPAVVSISNTYTETMSYFGQAMTSEATSSGSGIIIGKNDTELLIATNYHVISGADTLQVQFVEGSEATASVKGTDADMDLAVIAVPLEDILQSTLDEITIAALGDSDSLVVGEPAIAIGNSLGYGQSVTTGVISALDRVIELSDGSSGTFIQTDAAINPGNSGGALLNLKGEVIGINSNKIGGSAIEGMGYAIPISAAKPIIENLMLKETRNKVEEDNRGYLGISGISVTAEVSNAYDMPQGVYVAQVYGGSAAEEAGLKKGDIIVSFDGNEVSSMEALQANLEYYAKGETVSMNIMTIGNNGYHSKTIMLTLGDKVTE